MKRRKRKPVRVKGETIVRKSVPTVFSSCSRHSCCTQVQDYFLAGKTRTVLSESPRQHTLSTGRYFIKNMFYSSNPSPIFNNILNNFKDTIIGIRELELHSSLIFLLAMHPLES